PLPPSAPSESFNLPRCPALPCCHRATMGPLSADHIQQPHSAPFEAEPSSIAWGHNLPPRPASPPLNLVAQRLAEFEDWDQRVNHALRGIQVKASSRTDDSEIEAEYEALIEAKERISVVLPQLEALAREIESLEIIEEAAGFEFVPVSVSEGDGRWFTTGTITEGEVQERVNAILDDDTGQFFEWLAKSGMLDPSSAPEMEVSTEFEALNGAKDVLAALRTDYATLHALDVELRRILPPGPAGSSPGLPPFIAEVLRRLESLAPFPEETRTRNTRNFSFLALPNHAENELGELDIDDGAESSGSVTPTGSLKRKRGV
ncbi:hypothetical protein DFP72DRAFT_889329, partial [Ephemerocybe angulata]